MNKNRYSKQIVKVERKSGFDKSFQNLFTAKVGTIVPVLCDELIPNSTVDLKAAIQAALPPLASDTFMRCKLKYASFFVPTRLLNPGFEKWLVGDDNVVDGGNARLCPPVIQFPTTTSSTQFKKYLAPGTLADYLGIKMTTAAAGDLTVPVSTVTFSAYPFLGYHRIYNDWFRNSRVQKDIYMDNLSSLSAVYTVSKSKNVPSVTGGNTINPTISTQTNAGSPIFVDGVNVMDLRQANFDIDLFTAAYPEAQNGQAQSVSVALPEGSDGDGSFTISALRAANSIQQFLERNNLAGNKLVDYVKAQYGANLSDSIAQKPILLGSGEFDVYSKGIMQTSNSDTASTSSTQNPFNSVGARFGSASAEGTDYLVNHFTAQEPGYLYVLAWLSPRVTYGTGVDQKFLRYLSANSQSDMANPILQNVGNEPIFNTMINDKSVDDAHRTTVFGYSDRYFAWKDKVDEVHGILRDGETLESFALQRNFSAADSSVGISSDFLQIPTTYLDQVAAVSGDISKYGYWCDTYFDYKVSMPLAQYSVPSLQDPAAEHGESVVVNPNGKSLS